jgi:hypothetical protein
MGTEHKIITVSFTGKVTHAAVLYQTTVFGPNPGVGTVVKTACGIVRIFDGDEDDHEAQGTWDAVTCKRCLRTKKRK